MLHTAHGYWIAEAGAPDPLPQLETQIETDVLVVGGGFTGMWSAWHLKLLEPDTRVALIDSDLIGHGPSGRNGGFVDSMWVSFARLEQRYGTAAALEIARASEDSVTQIGKFCEEQQVDAWYRHCGYLNVSTSPAQDGAWDGNVEAMEAAGVAGEAEVLSAESVAATCDSPRFRGGIKYGAAATVQPARLGFGIRQALLEAGVELFESSPVTSVSDGPSGEVATTPKGRVRAEKVILASGPSLAGYGSPIRHSVTIASSHMVITEPVPEVIEQLGWTGGEAISDCRALLTYFRTTPDGRIAFGWGGGRIAAGGRRRGLAEVDPGVVEQVGRGLREYFPTLAGCELEYAWGGPIDASASHLPHAVTLPSGRAFAAFGYTGNGVGPSQMIGRCLASRVLERRDRYSSLALVEPSSALTRVPPEPFRWLGGTVIRDAIERKEKAEAAERRPGTITSMVSAIPKMIGFHIGR